MEIPELLRRLAILAPVFLLAIVAMLEPRALIAFANQLGATIESFGDRTGGLSWQQGRGRLDGPECSPRAERQLRVAGAVAIVLALASFA